MIALQPCQHMSVCQKVTRVRNGLLVEENTPLLQEVAAVANNFDTTLGVIAIQFPENLVV